MRTSRFLFALAALAACGKEFPEDPAATVTGSDGGADDAGDGGATATDGSTTDVAWSPGCSAFDAASFCDDFDRDGGAPRAEWNKTDDGGLLVTVPGFSVPNAIGAAVAQDSTYAILAADVPAGGASAIAFTFAMRIDAPASLSGGALDEIGLATFGPTHIIN